MGVRVCVCRQLPAIHTDASVRDMTEACVQKKKKNRRRLIRVTLIKGLPGSQARPTAYFLTSTKLLAYQYNSTNTDT